MPNTMLEKLRDFATKHKVTVLTATQPPRPLVLDFVAGEPNFGPPTGYEPIFIDYINLLH